MKLKTGITLAVIGLFGALSTAQAGSVKFSDFSNVSKLEFNGSAGQFGDVLRLIDSQQEAGSAFTNKAFIDTRDSFKSQFTSSMYSSSFPGDGMAFVIQPGPKSALGDLGGGMGYSGINKSVVIEFDLYANPETNDPDGNHIALMLKGDHTEHVKVKSPSFSLFETTVSTWVAYSAKREKIKVWATDQDAKPAKPLLKAPLDLKKVTRSPDARAGFTAGAGDASVVADVFDWKLTQ